VKSKKATRTPRQPGELPSVLDPERTLRALQEWGVTKAQFVKAYDATAKPRGGGVRTPDEALLRAFAAFKKSGDFSAFCKTLGVDSTTGNQKLGRMVRWETAPKS
jgi:hypothetical protein